MRLFFPNYEEIWGISIKDAANIDLSKDDFAIDFATDSEDKIDKFLSSLRGLVAAFKYSPILPIKNQYLNAVHGITGVALAGMNISTIPGFPFCLVVDLELNSFNHKPFLPMIKDFNQAVHWGKYRHYMGRAAQSLDAYINKEFLLSQDIIDTQIQDPNMPNLTSSTQNQTADVDPGTSSVTFTGSVNQSINDETSTVLKTNIIRDWRNGNNISVFMPERVQSRIFTPDTSTFRSQQEKILNDTGRNFWNATLYKFGIDINESAGYGRTLDSVVTTSMDRNYSMSVKRKVTTAIDLILAGRNEDGINDKIYKYLATAYILNNPIVYTVPSDTSKNYSGAEYLLGETDIAPSDEIKLFPLGGSTDLDQSKYSLKYIKNYLRQQSYGSAGLLTKLVEDLTFEKVQADNVAKNPAAVAEVKAKIKDELSKAFNNTLYDRFFSSGPIKDYIDAQQAKQNAYSFREWEVPMVQVDLDPEKVIVDGVNVSLGNSLVKLQLQLQEEPTYQHVGGKDSYVSISMTVFGEAELIKIRNIFEHINGLARLEHAAGVIGFLGIKNIITSLCGVKYVLPLRYNVDTIPGYPHVYKVQLTLVDFDIFQQKREKLSSEQQQKFVDEFGTKRNPFLRIKQLWGAFNAYPDLPLEIYDKNKNVVGCMDPDYYFRSFEMFDRDVIVNQSLQEATQVAVYEDAEQQGESSRSEEQKEINRYADIVADYLKKSDLEGLVAYLKLNNLSPTKSYKIVEATITKYAGQIKRSLLLDYIDELEEEDKVYIFSDTKFSVPMGEYSVGQITNSEEGLKETLDAVFSQTASSESEFVSIDPDNLTSGIEGSPYVHGLVYAIPASEDGTANHVPAMIQTAHGYNFGYLARTDGRFYLKNSDFTVKKINKTTAQNARNTLVDPTKTEKQKQEAQQVLNDLKTQENEKIDVVSFSKVADSQTPDKAVTKAHMSEIGTKALSEYQYAYSNSGSDPESIGPNGDQYSVTKHWEKMLVDTSYRDISGRMIRAFPTYMLWLIDEGGLGMAGVKIFDNFYGLQSIIDFSIVQSEDILGDTLIFRVSNMYSKLTRPEASEIYREGSSAYDDVNNSNDQSQPENMTQGLERIVDVLLRRQDNFRRHYENKYVVDIENIRLKPGVRVHLRGGYGSNPNSLQTLFNGMVTNVEQGEIVTVTCQSDAIELSPIINSANKKGDSGKIDGGLNTGMFLSEPRDLMVKLLSMGTSRFREAMKHATRGTVFSENKFGIRHFGHILYEPLNDLEADRNAKIKEGFKNAIEAASTDKLNASSLLKAAWSQTGGSYNGVDTGIGLGSAILGGFTGGPVGAIAAGTAGFAMRSPIVGHMRTLMANLNTQRDYEIFKRNIYPGNGLGVAQFLGGDLDSGWSTAATIDNNENLSEDRMAYVRRLGDAQWSKAIERNSALAESQARTVNGGALNDSSNIEGSAQFLSGLIGVAGAGLLAVGMPVVGSAMLGAGLLGVTNGRTAGSIFETLGLLSSLDDDMPGFDEVSFRAQTYMRSVWDMFQLCARLLPNYIVAVRPFEDRSTVFYGKPHWLYTSGVVPVSTGFLHPDAAMKKGLIDTGPKMESPDQELLDILNKINKEASPMQDATAFLKTFEPYEAAKQQANKIYTGTEEFAPVEYIKKNYTKKLINFYDPRRMFFYDSQENKIASRLPVNSGLVNVGFHLPFGEDQNQEISISEIAEKHKQIPQLPYRYQFPYFTSRATKAFDGRHSGYVFNYTARDLFDYREDEGDFNGPSSARYTGSVDFRNLFFAELSALSTSASGIFNLGDNISKIEGYYKLDSFQFTRGLIEGMNADFANSYAGSAFMDRSPTDYSMKPTISAAFDKMTMPLPYSENIRFTVNADDLSNKSLEDQATLFKEGSDNILIGRYKFLSDDSENQTYAPFEFENKDTYDKIKRLKIYKEWGTPKTAEQEQFYIAMRWPYNPEFFEEDTSLRDKFKTAYASESMGLNGNNSDISNYLFGKASDYKKRKVMVYSPLTNTAVVCYPAYFLWGNQKDAAFIENKIEYSSYATDAENPFIDAVVSPDAAYYLGILTSESYGTHALDRSLQLPLYGLDFIANSSLNVAEDSAGTDRSGRDNELPKDDFANYKKAVGVLGNSAGIQESLYQKDLVSKYYGSVIVPISRRCLFTFVEDDFPLGIIPSTIINPTMYDYAPDLDKKGKWISDKSFIIGFGTPASGADGAKAIFEEYNDADKDMGFQGEDLFKTYGDNSYREYGYLAEILKNTNLVKDNDAIKEAMFSPANDAEIVFETKEEAMLRASIGGNPIPFKGDYGYFSSVINGDFEKISKDNLYTRLAKEINTFKDGGDDDDEGRNVFVDIYDPEADYIVSTAARRNYDEDYDPTTSVIAGNGRTLSQAREIWDFFRVNFHEEKKVKDIFFETFGIDADDTEKLPEAILSLIINQNDDQTIFKRYSVDITKYNVGGVPTDIRRPGDASEEFKSLLGEKFISEGLIEGQDSPSGSVQPLNVNKIKEAVNYSSEIFLDTGKNYNGTSRKPLFEDLDYLLLKKYSHITGLLNFLIIAEGATENISSADDDLDPVSRSIAGFRGQLKQEFGGNYDEKELLKKIDSPKKLYLMLLGWFRQTLWSDPYMRAWIVLKPNRRLKHYSSNPLSLGIGDGDLKKSDGKWDFSPVIKAWQAFIDPNTDYAKKIDKFKGFLAANASEGDSATSWFSAAMEDTKDFWDKSVGVYFTAIADGLSGLLNMFKTSMAQMGYGLAEVDSLNKQANVLNKFLNDSIYYSLGDQGSLLRAVDNPFTREYGEPVVEIREPFQRIHYLSSFSHIMSNNIQENINDVATVVTAVSDGKYPVTVALDKSAPPERQTEKTVETGLYFDNIRGSGFFGVLHPIFHPFETVRGVSKMAQGAPDELTARRVALAHLRESIKDIYTGELVVIGSPDIRPHDLVYLADVYERMYGIFEVEQVVHHFTPDLGFITSITPNALVTVNDPARWFMTSWLNSWMSLQTIRNDTRMFLSAANSSRTGIVTGGQVSVESLNEALSAQMMGGVQYTHGHSALMKDVMANFTANAMPEAREKMQKQAKNAAGMQRNNRFCRSINYNRSSNSGWCWWWYSCNIFDWWCSSAASGICWCWSCWWSNWWRLSLEWLEVYTRQCTRSTWLLCAVYE